MKKMLTFALCAVLAFGMLSGCGNAAAGESQPTEYTQSPEEAAVLKILMIGQSHAQDSVWLLADVLKAHMPDKEFLVVDVYQPLTIAQHIENIKTDAAVYDYIEFRGDGTYHKLEGYRISVALKQEQWDLIIFNEATWPQINDTTHTNGNIQWLTDYIRETAAPGFQLAYNATWSHPVTNIVYEEGRATPPDIMPTRYLELFGGDKLEHFAKLCQIIETYVETDPDYSYVFHGGTALQYAAETHGVPEGDRERKYDLFRDYTHLSDFGRLIVAYQIYAQLFSPEGLTEIKIDKIPRNMRATSREQAFGDVEITQAHKDAIIASVNYALENPNKAPEQVIRQEAIMEPLQ